MIGEEGRAMRCKNCGHEWFQTLNGEEELKAHAAPDDDMSDDLQDAGEDTGQTDSSDDIDFDEDLDLGAFDPDAIPEQPDDDDDLENFYTADDDDAADQGEENADDSDMSIDDDSAELDAEDKASSQEDAPSEQVAADDDVADAQEKPKKGESEKSGALFGEEPEEITTHVFMASYGGAAVIFVAVLVLLMAVNRPVMHVFPGAASFYGLFGVQPPLEGEQLIISQLEAVTETNNDNVRVLSVQGEILNLGQADSVVPAMQISSSKDGQEALAWVEMTEKDTIAPDETVRFQVQHANPPADLDDLTVTFIPVGGEKALGRTVGVEDHTPGAHSAD